MLLDRNANHPSGVWKKYLIFEAVGTPAVDKVNHWWMCKLKLVT